MDISTRVDPVGTPEGANDRGWVALEAVVAAGMILNVLVIMVLVTGRLAPPLVTIGVLYAGCLGVMLVRRRAGAIAVGAVALLQLVLNLFDRRSFVDSLTDPVSPGEFLMTAAFLVLSLAGVAGLVGLLRRSDDRAARWVLIAGGALLALAVVISMLSTVGGETGGRGSATGSTIDVDDNDFVPGDLEVEVGTTVTWTWVGTNPHNAVSEGLFESELQTEGSFAYTPTEAGVIEFFCTVHPFMVGTLTVVETPAET